MLHTKRISHALFNADANQPRAGTPRTMPRPFSHVGDVAVDERHGAADEQQVLAGGLGPWAVGERRVWELGLGQHDHDALQEVL